MNKIVEQIAVHILPYAFVFWLGVIVGMHFIMNAERKRIQTDGQ